MPWVPRRLQKKIFASVTGEGGKRHTIIIWNSNDTCGGDIIVIQNAPLKLRGRDLEAFDLCSHVLSAMLAFALDPYHLHDFLGGRRVIDLSCAPGDAMKITFNRSRTQISPFLSIFTSSPVLTHLPCRELGVCWQNKPWHTRQ